MTLPDPTTAAATPQPADPQDWTCPFCSLLCDSYRLQWGAPPSLLGSDCPRARAALAHFPARPVAPSVAGQPVEMSAALDAAADILEGSAQPLFGGMATDVAGARALYRLADATGAILDHAHGDALMHATRALQDRGLFYTTLAEIRNRADLLVCIGTHPASHYPEFFRRCAPAQGRESAPEVVLLGAPEMLSAAGLESSRTLSLPLAGDLFDSVAQLAALLAGKRLERADADLAALAQRMLAAKYCVLVWESGAVPEQGALIAEAILRMVGSLNRSTRAASFCLGGADGAYSANYVMSWLSGLPLRSGVHSRGLVHEPLRYASARLLAEGAVDALLWVASFGPELIPPDTRLPRVVLGHPALAQRLDLAGECVFIPVATPGIGAEGHLFRADGGVIVPLAASPGDAMPGVAEVAGQVLARIRGGRA